MIINNIDKKLLPILKSHIKWATEIKICVAFFKLSGFNEIIEQLESKKPNNIEIITGVSFFQTEPVALQKAFSNKYQLYLQTIDSKKVFHPKIYLFRKGKNFRAIIGSSNMTKGGLVSNLEMSIQIDSKNNKSQINSLIKYFEYLKASTDFEQITSTLRIENYKLKFDKYHKTIDKAQKKAAKEVKQENIFDIAAFKEYVKDNKDIISKASKYKNKNYLKSKKELIKIKNTLYRSTSNFMKDYQKVIDLMDSSGLNRGKSIYSKEHEKIKKIIEIASNTNDKNYKENFENAKLIIDKVPKMGINALTEILNTFQPKIFPVLNGRTLSVLRDLGLVNNRPSNSYSIDEYFAYRDNIMKEIRSICSFKDYRETDLAISYYYSDEILN